MIVFVVLLLLIALYQCKPFQGKGFYEDYVSIDQTRAINGIFSMLILLSHTFAKISPNDTFGAFYAPMRVFLGQFVVVPFLFYSGYGIMNALTNRSNYLKDFPRKRLLKLFVRFAVITVVYIALHWIIGSKFPIWYILMSFVGITSIGNGGWYILSTLVFYIAVIFCFNIFKKNKWIAVGAVILCLVMLTVIEMLVGFPSYYYSTTIFFGVGMVYALLKEWFDNIVMKNNLVWSAVFLVGIAGFVCLKRLVNHSVVFYPIWCGFGMLSILCLTMKVMIQNRMLIWIGKLSLFCFTLQGIPQIVFARLLNNCYLICTVVIICTLALMGLADKAFTKWERILYERRRSSCLRS